jgi:hypothetical protein
MKDFNSKVDHIHISFDMDGIDLNMPVVWGLRRRRINLPRGTYDYGNDS